MKRLRLTKKSTWIDEAHDKNEAQRSLIDIIPFQFEQLRTMYLIGMCALAVKACKENSGGKNS